MPSCFEFPILLNSQNENYCTVVQFLYWVYSDGFVQKLYNLLIFKFITMNFREVRVGGA